MSRRGWVGWLEDHRSLVAGIVFWALISLSGVLAVANGAFRSVSASGAEASSTAAGRDRKDGTTAGGSQSTKRHHKKKAASGQNAGAHTAKPSTNPSSESTIPGSPPIVPGTSPLPPCSPFQPKGANGQSETGITDTKISVGQIITDSSLLPGQFRPAYEGLMAYTNLVNRKGGICGRSIDVQMQNDHGNPSTHYYRDMAQSVFAFVGDSSLFDGNDYQSTVPFDPEVRDSRTNEFVPDVGGLAFSYGRAQSAWHAGVIGSVSPVLVGGGQFKYFVENAKADTGHACAKAGVIYLVEPTGASKDQAELGKAALEAGWGGGMGVGNVNEYSVNLAAPTLEFRGIIQHMVRDGVNCAFSYTDLASNINLAKALDAEGVWPPGECNRSDQSECFGVVWVPFTAYDPEFVRDGGAGAKGVVTFIPQLPLGETSNPALSAYLAALAQLKHDRPDVCSDSTACEPSTYSVLGYASGIMFEEAVAACGGGPTRTCVMDHLRSIRNFTGGGLLGGTSPFARTCATYEKYGSVNWKWVFGASVAVRVEGEESDYLHRWHRIRPSSGFFHDTLYVARGTAC